MDTNTSQTARTKKTNSRRVWYGLRKRLLVLTLILLVSTLLQAAIGLQLFFGVGHQLVRVEFGTLPNGLQNEPQTRWSHNTLP